MRRGYLNPFVENQAKSKEKSEGKVLFYQPKEEKMVNIITWV